MLSTMEELLLIAIDDETGQMNASESIHFGLAGAIIMELTSKGCLDYQKGKLVFLDQTDAGDKLLNESLAFLREKHNNGKLRNLKYWVEKLGNEIHRKKLHLSYIDRLIDKGIIKQEETKFLFFFTKDVYPSLKTGKENAIRAKVKEAVLDDSQEVDEQTMVLIGLLKACSLAKTIFSKDEYKIANKKINEMMKNNPHGKAVSDTIQAMEAAVIAIITAATVISTTSSSS
ncbi:GOLPH3/VPS74 family protein [Salinibacillus xinjiangensis]|uniref:GPP34 family phosphoprotein n=1 Tax=Salinibacillus xinjiangensis TaxID=1229268 RepID=A0A6G1X5Q0_9BACI|nr:GPP34 family phosphoprotein [Salinibacillus xinjiangensis]MRG86148.1 hypothetical protein [Salinibacillus xinjiangensis]